jgi:hypothetical protein
MNANHELERRLVDHYASEAPQRAPDRVLEGALLAIDSTRQRRAPLPVPWRFQPMNSYAKVAIAAVAVVAIGAVGLAVLRPGPDTGPGVVTPSSPSPSAESSAPASPGTVAGRADTFVRAFDYRLPSDPVFDYGTRNDTYFETRVPTWADAGHAGGLIVQAIGGGRVSPCDEASATRPIEPGAQAVFDYLAGIAQLTMSDSTAVTVDGRPALQAMVVADTGTPACPELRVWTESTETFITEIPLRLIAVEVDGENIVLTIFGEPGNPDWPALANQIVESIRFDPATGSAAP